MSELSKDILSAIAYHPTGSNEVKDFILEVLFFEKDNDDKSRFSFKPEMTEMLNKYINRQA